MAERLSSESLSFQTGDRHQDDKSDVDGDAETGFHLTDQSGTSWRTITSKYPRAHAQTVRFLQYCKGPRPRIDLPGCFPIQSVLHWWTLTPIP